MVAPADYMSDLNGDNVLVHFMSPCYVISGFP